MPMPIISCYLTGDNQEVCKMTEMNRWAETLPGPPLPSLRAIPGRSPNPGPNPLSIKKATIGPIQCKRILPRKPYTLHLEKAVSRNERDGNQKVKKNKPFPRLVKDIQDVRL
jgi:hypothetical protein